MPSIFSNHHHWYQSSLSSSPTLTRLTADEANGYYTTIERRVDEMRESYSPHDDDGYGTYTSTTITGSLVSFANLLGYVTGTACGMVTHARLAVYKVFWVGGCFNSEILAGAMDRVVANDYHMLSISIGSDMTLYYSMCNGYLPLLPVICTATISASAHSPAQRHDGFPSEGLREI
ncbi:hypothetical protein J5N97_030176 [Dioscorea zingiberensis]|uniref:Uncharacterized protein n=1 Tax=Dioscorea zingiberensis TaxID=325984 RepID=A0A9D5BX67_9LILI|nr:hypothetical protein J5N97_030176 [Dioscorea zingiberensis]